MKLQKGKPSGREKGEASMKLLARLRGKLYSDVSTARRAAFNLSWMQEDGLEILKENLLGDSPKSAKTAAAYGLRSMRGRMKKMALGVFEQGLIDPNPDIKEACIQALTMLRQRPEEKSHAGKQTRAGKFKIVDIPPTSRQRRKMDYNRSRERKSR